MVVVVMSEHALEQRQPPQKILIIDDSNVIRTLLSITLEKSGYQVDSAENLSQATVFLNHNQYRLLVLDYMLDLDTTGFDLINAMQQKKYALPPIIMLSAEGSFHHQEQAKSLGIKAWMRKPFTPQSIIKLIQKILTTDQADKNHSQATTEANITGIG